MADIINHTTRAPGTVLTASIYNQDHLVHISNAYALNDDVNLQHAVAVGLIIDGSGYPPDTGIKGDTPVPFDCEILGAFMTLDVVGDAVLDLWSAPFGDYPPTVADSITDASPLTISSDLTVADETMTGWTTELSEGSLIRWNLNSISTATRITAWLNLRRK